MSHVTGAGSNGNAAANLHNQQGVNNNPQGGQMGGQGVQGGANGAPPPAPNTPNIPRDNQPQLDGATRTPGRGRNAVPPRPSTTMFEVDIRTGLNIPRTPNNQNQGGNGGAAQPAPQATNTAARTNRADSSDSMETQAAFDGGSEASFEQPEIRSNTSNQGEPLEQRTPTPAVQYSRDEVNGAFMDEAAMDQVLEELENEMLNPEDFGGGTNLMTMGDDPRRALMAFDRPASDDSIWDMSDAGSTITEESGTISTEATTETDDSGSTTTDETDSTTSDDRLRYGRRLDGGGGFFSSIGSVVSSIWSFITGPFRRA